MAVKSQQGALVQMNSNAPKIFFENLEEVRSKFIYDLTSPSCVSRFLANGATKHCCAFNKVSGYYIARFHGRSVACHHIVMILHNKLPDEYEVQVDHIDNNRQNNTFENLRWVTRSENVRNTRSIGNRKSFSDMSKRYVYFSGITGLYVSQWTHPDTGELVVVGSFPTMEEASFYAKVDMAEKLGRLDV